MDPFRKKRMKQSHTTAGKGVKKVSKGHGMGGLFSSVTPKKPEFDKPPRTRSADRAQKADRMKRLDKRFI